jgi:hypothetical protein
MFKRGCLREDVQERMFRRTGSGEDVQDKICREESEKTEALRPSLLLGNF